MNTYFQVLKKYAVFSGRARRREYWLFVLINGVISLVITLVPTLLGFPTFSTVMSYIYTFAVLIPSLAVASRRLHDVGQSAWWLLVILVPFLGAAILIWFTTLDSEVGDNKYGPNPKNILNPTASVADPSV